MQTTNGELMEEIDSHRPYTARIDLPLTAPRSTSAGGLASRPEEHVAALRQNGENHSDKSLVETIVNSKVFQDYERAFTGATGLPIALRPLETWQLPFHGKRKEGHFCALMSEQSRTCAACLQVQEKLSKSATQDAHTVTCLAGLCETAVPVRLGDRLIGFLQTGQVFLKKPTQARFEGTRRALAAMGVQKDCEQLKTAYFGTPVLPAKQHESIVRLLTIFAQHLSMLSNQVVVQRQNSELPAITRAKQYIQEHQGDDISLDQVAKAVHMSTFYFCKVFKKVTGINFTDYVCRVRIEKAKNLLLNPNLRVSEIAFEIGFQSLTHFNRVFKRTMGQSPSEYRAQLMAN